MNEQTLRGRVRHKKSVKPDMRCRRWWTLHRPPALRMVRRYPSGLHYSWNHSQGNVACLMSLMGVLTLH
ncbi:hypothetical protein JG688_00016527 [Phytophthora aleatoria]|uniref:Uncharacterized protein n=1 Tax=Phytophthora aleatoria TaxID=2496075 RepID=A0A8J5MCT7_9STRA|nr:hypothetical protein JG688_00016527 [Phytophthora aleatoria]